MSYEPFTLAESPQALFHPYPEIGNWDRWCGGPIEPQYVTISDTQRATFPCKLLGHCNAAGPGLPTADLLRRTAQQMLYMCTSSYPKFKEFWFDHDTFSAAIPSTIIDPIQETDEVTSSGPKSSRYVMPHT